MQEDGGEQGTGKVGEAGKSARGTSHRRGSLAAHQLRGLIGAGTGTGQAWMSIFTSLLRKHLAQAFWELGLSKGQDW